MGEEEKKARPYKLVDTPHLHTGFDKNELMMKTFLMMVIIAFASVIVMGMPALIHILVAIGSVLVVYCSVDSYQKWKGVKPTYDSPASPLVAGMIVGLCMTLVGPHLAGKAPYTVTALVGVLTMLVFKYGQGRYFKRKYLNPAAAAKAMVLLVIYGIYALNEIFEGIFGGALEGGMLFHPHHYQWDLTTAQGFERMMDWAFAYETVPVFGTELTPTQSLLFWQTHSWIGGASSIVTLIVGVIAVYWLRYKWRIVLSCFATMTILALGIGLYLPGGNPIMRVAFHVFTGSFIFMVFFMATEPQSTPMPEISQYIFGIALAILTFVFQIYGFVGGSIIALVMLNIATPFMDKIVIKKAYGFRTKSKGVKSDG